MCNAHILKELNAIAELEKQFWSKDMEYLDVVIFRIHLQELEAIFQVSLISNPSLIRETAFFVSLYIYGIDLSVDLYSIHINSSILYLLI